MAWVLFGLTSEGMDANTIFERVKRIIKLFMGMNYGEENNIFDVCAAVYIRRL